VTTAEPTDDPGGNAALIARISREIAASGDVIPFARFMELALYHPDLGYYMSRARRPGRGGDFITAPEASPHFGHTLARQFAEFWERLGKPGQWAIREYGSGIGGLAYDIMAGLDSASPAAFDALTYHLVEINPSMREEARWAMSEAGLAEKIVLEDPNSDLPPIEGAFFGNEVADAFPVHRLIRTERRESAGGWREVGVTGDASGFAWKEMAVSEGARHGLDALTASGIDVPAGSVVDIIPAASAWFAGAAAALTRGYAMVIDYGYPEDVLYRSHRLEGTVRGYYGHTVTDDPFVRVGEQDLTAHVDFTALQRAGELAGMRMEGFTTQGALLSSLDLGDAILRLQQDPTTTTEEYLATQAVVLRLIDPGGLGRFGVLIMSAGMDDDRPLRSFRDLPPSF
jgi:SAM-dependent MidA family methyltransferase